MSPCAVRTEGAKAPFALRVPLCCVQGEYVRRAIAERHVKEDCLVDAWVPDGR